MQLISSQVKHTRVCSEFREENYFIHFFVFFFVEMSSGFCATPNFSATALNHHPHGSIAAAAAAHAAHHPGSLHHNGALSNSSAAAAAAAAGHGHMSMSNLTGSGTNPAVALTAAAAVLDTTCFMGPGWTPAGLNEARECVNCGGCGMCMSTLYFFCKYFYLSK